jgi:transposase
MNNSKKEPKIIRHFSVDFKKNIVNQIDAKLTTVSQISRDYQVSRSAILQWQKQYSPHYQKPTKLVIEMESEALKTQQLQDRNAQLERIIGQKQLQIDYLEKLIELASEELKTDLKKNFATPPSTISEKKEK